MVFYETTNYETKKHFFFLKLKSIELNEIQSV